MNFSSDSMPFKIIDIFSSPGQSAKSMKNDLITKIQTNKVDNNIVTCKNERKSRQ